MSQDDEALQLALALSKSEHEARLEAKRFRHDELERASRAQQQQQQQQDADMALALSLAEADDAKLPGPSPVAAVDAKLQAKWSKHEEIARAKAKAQEEDDFKFALSLSGQGPPPAAPSSGSGGISSMISGIFKAPSARPTAPPAGHPLPGCCWRCRLPVLGAKITALDRTYCQPCFVCEGCGAPISGRFFPHEAPGTAAAAAAVQRNRDGARTSTPTLEPYCQGCVRELFGLRCCVCEGFLEGRYLKHSFFAEEKYCVVHEDQRRVCYSCARLEPFGATARGSKEGAFVAIPDGRFSCPSCIMTAVLDSSEARPLFLEAVDFIERRLGLPIPPGMRDVPVLAVDATSLNEQQQHSDKKRGMPSVRGLTLYTTSVRTVTQISYVTPGQFQWDAHTGLMRAPQAVPQPRYTVEHHPTREVTCVLVLFALPRDLTASILAHEAMHVWLKLSSGVWAFPTDLARPCEEGLCQLVAERYLADREQTKRGVSGTGTGVGAGAERRVLGLARGPGADAESEARDAKLREYFQFAIHTDRSPVYGDGFRAAHRTVAALGLEVVLEHVKATRDLPPV